MIGSGTASATRAQDNICMKHLPIFLKQELQIGQKNEVENKKKIITQIISKILIMFLIIIFSSHMVQ
jgi:hypothetical protein